MAKSKSRKNNPLPLVLIIGGAIAVLAVVAVVFSGGSGDVYGEVTVRGAGLPVFADGVPDGAIGQPAPEFEGVDFDGNNVTIGNDGRAKLILVLAHW